MAAMDSAKDAVSADEELTYACSYLRAYEALPEAVRQRDALVDMLTMPKDGFTLSQRAAMFEAAKDQPQDQKIPIPEGAYKGYEITIRHLDETMHSVQETGGASKGVMYEIFTPEGDLYNHLFISNERAAEDRRLIESEKRHCEEYVR